MLFVLCFYKYSFIFTPLLSPPPPTPCSWVFEIHFITLIYHIPTISAVSVSWFFQMLTGCHQEWIPLIVLSLSSWLNSSFIVVGRTNFSVDFFYSYFPIQNHSVQIATLLWATFLYFRWWLPLWTILSFLFAWPPLLLFLFCTHYILSLSL